MAENLNLSAAQAVVEAARAKAEEIGQPMNIAVVDAGSNLTAFARMDGAWLGCIDISKNKAYTSRAFDMPTKDLAPLAQPGGRSSASRRPTRTADHASPAASR